MVSASSPCKSVHSFGLKAGRRGAAPPLPPLPQVLGAPGRQQQEERSCFTDFGDGAIAVNSALVEGGLTKGIGALRKTGPGVLIPTIFQAANERKSRAKEALVAGRAAEQFREVESSELCGHGRSCVKSWALGRISGRQCMLRLQFCSSGVELFERMPQRRAAHESEEAALWLVGFARPGPKEHLEALQHDLETKTPCEMLLQAWEALESECGASAGRLDLDEINLTLRRLSVRKGGSTITGTPTNPSAFLRVQIWRELIRIHLGTRDNADMEPSGEFLDDKAILEWTAGSDQQLCEVIKSLEQKELLLEADRLSGHASRMVQIEKQLRSALQEWTRFDPWKILGVKRGSSLGEVRRAFFKKALQLHPDKGGGKAQFQELQRAYDEVLSELGAQRTAPDVCEEDAPQEKSKDTKEKQEKEQQEKEKPSEEKKAKKENDDGKSGYSEVSEEGQAFTRGESMKWLERVAAKVAAASEAAGDKATTALRNCHAATEALQQSPTDCLRASANLEAALRTVRKLSQAASLAARFTSEAADAFETRAQATLEKLESLVESTREVAAAVKAAGNHCLATVAQVAEALKHLQWTGPGARPSQENLMEAVTSLSESCRKAAVVSIEAAEALAQAIPAIRAARLVETDAEETEEQEFQAGETEAPEDEIAEPAEQSEPTEDTKPKEKESPAKAEGGEADEGLECRKALSRIKEARRLLQRCNRGMLELQRAGRKLAVEDSSALPVLPAKCHERTFNLLAEFLDEAARRFHERLKSTVSSLLTADATSGSMLQSWVLKALDEAFCFWLHSSPALAMPSDPRAQILRAAIAMDSTAVRNMLQAQVAKRLEGIVSLVLLEARPATPPDDGVASALGKAHMQLSNSLSSLEQGPA
mmetsp:Transcript_25910/g.46846  ORF Transcript_25910/g.46846 Transcript_25910/m.46846 type:complete len:881 (+) Transcript_25910:21-2663(+)